MPLTSYATQFMQKNGVTLPSQEPIRKALPNSPLCVKTSTYQNTFPNKSSEVKIIDYRELDCAKNKLKYFILDKETSTYPLHRAAKNKQ